MTFTATNNNISLALLLLLAGAANTVETTTNLRGGQQSKTIDQKPKESPVKQQEEQNIIEENPVQGNRFQFDSESLRNTVGDFMQDRRAVESKYGPIGDWDVSQVTDFSHLFYRKGGFQEYNEDISGWDTSSATTMAGMFCEASSFNANTAGWDTSSVTSMNQMFYKASSFNQLIGDWDTSSVEDISDMFRQASSFNQYIGNWDTSNIEEMQGVFESAIQFNQDIGGWDTSKAVHMQRMFYKAENFNQHLTRWNTSKVQMMYEMFFRASSFNGNLEGWDTSNVLQTNSMFSRATKFNQPLWTWKTPKVRKMNHMFFNAKAYNQGYLCWDLGSLFDETGGTYAMFDGTPGFNSVDCSPNSINILPYENFNNNSYSKNGPWGETYHDRWGAWGGWACGNAPSSVDVGFSKKCQRVETSKLAVIRLRGNKQTSSLWTTVPNSPTTSSTYTAAKVLFSFYTQHYKTGEGFFLRASNGFVQEFLEGRDFTNDIPQTRALIIPFHEMSPRLDVSFHGNATEGLFHKNAAVYIDGVKVDGRTQW